MKHFIKSLRKKHVFFYLLSVIYFCLSNSCRNEEPITETIIPPIKTESNSNKIVCFGDSTTENGSPGSPYPSYLQNLLPNTTTIANEGVSGKMSASIAMKFGGIRIFTNSNITIPESGAIQGEYIQEKIVGRVNNITYKASILGINGTITIKDDWDGYQKFVFTRDNNGTAVKIPINTEIISDSKKYHQDLLIIWVGQNDLAWGWPYVENAPLFSVKACIEKLNVDNKKFLVIGITNSKPEFKENTTNQNNLLRAEYPDNFIDLQNIFITKGLQMTNINPTDQDLQYIENGLIPRSLLYDDVHPNDIAKKKIIAPIIYEKLVAKGWIK